LKNGLISSVFVSLRTDKYASAFSLQPKYLSSYKNSSGGHLGHLNEQLFHLISLQSVDSRILANKRELDKIPDRLAAAESVLDHARAREVEFKEKLESLTKQRRAREMDLEDSVARVKTLKGRVSEVKSNIEYQARLKEIDAAETSTRNVEDEILVLMESIEAMSADRKEVEETFQEASRQMEEIRAGVKESGSLLEQEIKALKSDREARAGEVDNELYQQYKSLMEEAHGLAVVLVRDRICNGCNMSIPPQLYNEVRSTDRIYTCPECSRMLYYKDKE